MLAGLEKIYSRNLWTSIEDMPIYSWDSIIRTGTYDDLYKKGSNKVYKQGELQGVWLDIQQQHLEEFGTDQALKTRIRIMIRLNNLNHKFIATGDRNLLNFIYIEEENLKDGESKHFTLYEIVDAIETYKKFAIDPKDYTVIKYFHALKSMANGSN